ncbi:ABC transporter ATP-binding protein [Actinomyces minihominis]|uniref:ABC transporter ATP-binding protein n=1 Tax=Actinomyces minihominis TaxID=2002838 RepID=UPI001F5D5669|nr:ABC transporter ATP-binding protein [Actinomyces minihominis]
MQKDDTKRGIEVTLGGPSVVVNQVTKEYTAPVSGPAARSNASKLALAANKYLRRPLKTKVRSVDNVSLVVQAGESIGLLGANGAGKSTLLRLIAGSEPTTSGEILARSQPTLLGVSAALVPALSGLRNIELGCLAVGLSPEETKEVIPRIADLTGIGDAIERPMETYSSGMGARLRFAINVAVKPDILLIDEALGTGDAAFTAKSEEILAEIRRDAGTIFLVSHAAQTIEKMCTRAIWMHEGRVISDGSAYETARRYRLWAHRMVTGEVEAAEKMLAEEMASMVEKRLVFDDGESISRRRHVSGAQH